LVSLVETVYLLRSPENARRLLDAIEESKTGKIQSQTIAELQQELGIDQEEEKKAEPNEIQPVIINRSPGFSSKFKEDIAWWFKQDFVKASKILDLITAVMQDPFEGIGKPEPLKYMDANIWSRRIDARASASIYSGKHSN
jgi:toxin YoeB